MPVNDNKPKSPEDIINEMVGGFLNSFTEAASKNAQPEVDPLKEANRLLKKAEAVASLNSLESGAYLSIADRHIKIIELALAYQK